MSLFVCPACGWLLPLKDGRLLRHYDASAAAVCEGSSCASPAPASTPIDVKGWFGSLEEEGKVGA